MGNGPVPQDTSGLLGGITIGKLRRIMSEALDKALDKHFDESKKSMNRMSETTAKMLRATDQRLAGLENDVRQPHLTTETDIPTDKKTRKCAEDAATDQTKHEDRCSAKRVDTGPTRTTSFGMKAEPPAIPGRDDVLVDKGAEAPDSCHPPVKTCTLTAADGLLSVGTTSTAMRTIFLRPFFSLSLGGETKKVTVVHKQPPPPPLLVEGYSNEIKANSSVRSWWSCRSSTHLPVSEEVARDALWGGFRLGARWCPRLERFLVDGGLGISFFKKVIQAIRYAVRITVDHCSRPRPG